MLLANAALPRYRPNPKPLHLEEIDILNSARIGRTQTNPRSLQLEEIDILNSARIGRNQTYPVPEQPYFARFLDFSKPYGEA